MQTNNKKNLKIEFPIKITLLGTGTSTGVPVPTCNCSVCTSKNPKNKRFRTSALIEFKSPIDQSPRTILIDSTPDLRSQVLANSVKQIDAVLYTHAHADHIFGIDDLRVFNFAQKSNIPIYADAKAREELVRVFSYIFSDENKHQGAPPPKLKLNTIVPYQSFNLFGLNILPILATHGNTEVVGFKFGSCAYLTDCKEIPDKTTEALKNLDTLVISCLRARVHRTHINHAEAKTLLRKIKPKKTFFTHIGHDHSHEEIIDIFSEFSALPGYDGQVIQ